MSNEVMNSTIDLNTQTKRVNLLASTRSTNRLIIKYKQINTVLSFSDIREWPDATQAFARFVDEMSSALHVIQSLRKLVAQRPSLHEKQIAEALFRKVIQATADYYSDAHAYARLSAQIAQPANDPESKILLDFELTAGRYIRELKETMSVLQGYLTYPLQIDHSRAESAWDPRDWCIDRLIKLITSHEQHVKWLLLFKK